MQPAGTRPPYRIHCTGNGMEYPELRVSFHLRDEHDERRYNVELNCVIPGEAAEDFSGPFPIEFDWDHPDSRAVALPDPIPRIDTGRGSRLHFSKILG